jgi:hypothetical protein
VTSRGEHHEHQPQHPSFPASPVRSQHCASRYWGRRRRRAQRSPSQSRPGDELACRDAILQERRGTDCSIVVTVENACATLATNFKGDWAVAPGAFIPQTEFNVTRKLFGAQIKIARFGRDRRPNRTLGGTNHTDSHTVSNGRHEALVGAKRRPPSDARQTQLRSLVSFRIMTPAEVAGSPHDPARRAEMGDTISR